MVDFAIDPVRSNGMFGRVLPMNLSVICFVVQIDVSDAGAVDASVALLVMVFGATCFAVESVVSNGFAIVVSVVLLVIHAADETDVSVGIALVGGAGIVFALLDLLLIACVFLAAATGSIANDAVVVPLHFEMVDVDIYVRPMTICEAARGHDGILLE